MALGGGGEVDPTTSKPAAVTLLHRNGSTCRVAGIKYVIDGSPEAFGARAFDLPVVLGREAWHNSTGDDPTTAAEAYAGRRSFSVQGHGAPVDSWSDKAVEAEDTSSGAGTITNLCRYVTNATRGSTGQTQAWPWLLTNPPAGYRADDFVLPAKGNFVDGSCCDGSVAACQPQVFRYQGLTLSRQFAQKTGATGPTLPRW